MGAPNWRKIGVLTFGVMAIIAVVAVIVDALTAAGGLRPGAPSSVQAEVTLLYIGADDCAPCRSWQSGEGASFRSSSKFSRVVYREVKSSTVLDVLKDENWPDDLRRYRSQLGRGAGVPMWLVLVNDDIVGRGFGPGQWREAVLPKINSLIR